MRAATLLALMTLVVACSSPSATANDKSFSRLWHSMSEERKETYVLGFIAGTRSALNFVGPRILREQGLSANLSDEARERLKWAIMHDILTTGHKDALLREMESLYEDEARRDMPPVQAIQIAADRVRSRDTAEIEAVLREHWAAR